MARRDLRPARCMHIEATPSGQGPVVHAHILRYHVARSSSSGGAGAQERGPLESISPCCAIQSFHDCLLGESGDHVGQGQPLCKWVSSSALSHVSEPRPPKRPPTRRLLLPRTGLAHGAGLNAAHLTYQLLPVRARDSLLRVAAVPPSAPTVGPGPPHFKIAHAPNSVGGLGGVSNPPCSPVFAGTIL